MARILIVDDDEMDRVLGRAILQDAGHELLFASDGEAALRLFRDNDVELVLTDLAMPNLNGLRLIRELRELDPAVKVIAVSGMSPEQLPSAEDFGAVKTFFKPLDPSALLETVEAILDEDEVDWENVWGP